MKYKVPIEVALPVANELKERLSACCERIEIVGSIRRRKPEVGDIELLFIPKWHKIPVSLFGDEVSLSVANSAIDTMLLSGILEKRPSKTGVFSWGEKNKLSIHVPSGIAVDFFSTTADCWWNSLVCRTGGKDNNLLITTTAQRQGWSFQAYGNGFGKLGHTEHHQTTSEQDVYEFLGLPYLEPWERK